MTKLFAALASVAAIALAAPAGAQYQSQYPHGYQTDARAGGVMGIRNQIAQMEARIDAGIRAGTINRREATRLRAELRQIQRTEARYSRGGLSREQHAELRQRIRALHRDIRTADRGSWDRYDRFAEYDDPRYGRDPYGRDPYGRDPYGRYQGRGGPMEPIQACEPRGGVGGLIGGLLGIDDCPGLRVGQRVTGNLYGVPQEYSHQFRDGGGLYHRSDGRVIYAIDARSHTVVRVYPLH